MAKGDSQDPAWAYITVALDKATTFAKDHKYNWKGRSCYVVSRAALLMVMLTRQGKTKPSGEQFIPTTNPADVNLAYADHYLHTRGVAAKLGPALAWVKLSVQIEGYDAYKKSVIGMSELPGGPDAKPFDNFYRGVGLFLEYEMREGDKTQPLSRGGPLQKYWAYEGVKDGITDFQANPGIDNDPALIGLSEQGG